MEQPKYNTTWFQKGEDPIMGSTCPKCGNGIIEPSQFGGYWCKGCKWKWKLSKFSKEPQQTETQIKKENELFDVFDMASEMKKLIEEVRRIHKRLDDLGEFLKTKLPS